MISRMLGMTAVLVLAVAAPAWATSTVSVIEGGVTLKIDGDTAQNQVTVDYAVANGGTPDDPSDDVGYVTVRDPSGLQSGDGCNGPFQNDAVVECQDVGGAIAKYIVNLGAGDDRLNLVAFFTSGITDGGAGNDEVNGATGGTGQYPGNDTFNGGPDNDAFSGNLGDDTFNGGDGNDTASGSAGKDLLRGDGGDDELFGEAEEDRLFGGEGNDKLLGGPGNDPDISGEGGNDEVRGDAGDDLVRGGDGDDKLEYYFALSTGGQGAGRDDLSGGNGKDQVSYGDHAGGVTVTLDDAANDGTSSEGDNVRVDIEVVTGSNQTDTITGSEGANELNGDSGDDVINGNGGDDTLNGGIGKDRVNGGAGADKLEGSSDEDVLDGGSGRDTFEGDPPCTLNGCSGGSDDILARDGEEDRVNCGVGADKVTADQFDIVATDPQQGCETVDRATVGGAPVTPANPGPPANPASAVAFRLIGRARLRALLRSGLTFEVTCAGPCKVAGVLSLKRRTVASGRKTALAGGKVRVKVKVSKAGKRALRRLRRATLSLKVTITDSAGKKTTFTRRIVFRR